MTPAPVQALTAVDIRHLILERRTLCGVGLCGRYSAIVRWLHREHGVITTESMAEHFIKQASAEPAGGGV